MDIDAAPGLVVDQVPAVSAAGYVLGEQHVARLDHLLVAVARFELQGAAEREDVLAVRRVVPLEARARRRLLEADGLRGLGAGDRVRSHELVPSDLAHGEMRLAVGTGEKPDQPHGHGAVPPRSTLAKATGAINARLVSRFRSSHVLPAHSDANFGIKGTLPTL